MARLGFEPRTSWMLSRRSNHLSYLAAQPTIMYSPSHDHPTIYSLLAGQCPFPVHSNGDHVPDYIIPTKTSQQSAPEAPSNDNNDAQQRVIDLPAVDNDDEDNSSEDDTDDNVKEEEQVEGEAQQETPEPEETPPPRPRRRRAAPRVDDSDDEAEVDDRPVAVRRPKRDIRPPGEWWKVPAAPPKAREATPDVWEMRDPTPALDDDDSQSEEEALEAGPVGKLH
ncbi:hypothetical protein PLEOSDRAFT_158255 [Pleurotus ostreatus PC15]|uniref:Uncharacterized protein n=1 Tax=Pleurotus ostreatus (strain PC15) TaxID=1137138 RepID=A0A067NLK6_PLEO1|nr:hypothetical protein PLEOSDRAFT_158255 [Pleurotus ostreatus PC15]